MADRETAEEKLANLRELGDHRVFNTMIKQTVKLGEAPLTGKPVTEYATGSAAARAGRPPAAACANATTAAFIPVSNTSAVLRSFAYLPLCAKYGP